MIGDPGGGKNFAGEVLPRFPGLLRRGPGADTEPHHTFLKLLPASVFGLCKKDRCFFTFQKGLVFSIKYVISRGIDVKVDSCLPISHSACIKSLFLLAYRTITFQVCTKKHQIFVHCKVYLYKKLQNDSLKKHFPGKNLLAVLPDR